MPEFYVDTFDAMRAAMTARDCIIDQLQDEVLELRKHIQNYEDLLLRLIKERLKRAPREKGETKHE